MIFVKIEIRFLLGISLGITDNTIQSASNRRLVNLLTYVACKNILKWISDKLPMVSEWLMMIFGFLSLEYIT